MPNFWPSQAAVMPITTTKVLQTSVEKWSASACRASLGYFCATRERARERTRSMTIAAQKNDDGRHAGTE